jgi:hypothetical protein
MKETFELINDIINTISKTITIKSVTVNLDDTIDIQVNKTLWLTVSNRPITINGVDYKIKSITNNLLIKLFPNATTPTVGTFEAYDFYFWHGTVIEVNNELNKIKASADKFPMCYLVEVLEEQNNYSELSTIGRSINARLLFAVETDYTNKDTEGLYSSGINPTRNFVNEFINAVDNNDLVASFDDNYTTIPLTRIARYDANGHRTKVINSELTGLELRINIDFSKNCDCCEVSTDTVSLNGNDNVFLTCGTLADCQTIIDIETELLDHEERITALEQGGGGGGLTCQTIGDCQTIIDLETNKVDKEVGKGLSTNDLTNTLKSNYDTAYSQTHTHANKSILDSIQEALTTALKGAYDGAVSWISTNGTNILNHISSTSNPHQTKTFLFIQHATTNPVDSETRYFAQRSILPQTVENTNRVYADRTTKIVGASIQLYSSTAGSNEDWSMYIRVNDTTDYLIATVSQNANIRLFENSSLNITLNDNDWFSIKLVNPIWGTNPVGTTGAGQLTVII